MTKADDIKSSLDRIERLDGVIKAQKAFLGQIPDPDTRERAESNLMEMVMTVQALRDIHLKLLDVD